MSSRIRQYVKCSVSNLVENMLEAGSIDCMSGTTHGSLITDSYCGIKKGVKTPRLEVNKESAFKIEIKITDMNGK